MAPLRHSVGAVDQPNHRPTFSFAVLLVCTAVAGAFLVVGCGKGKTTESTQSAPPPTAKASRTVSSIGPCSTPPPIVLTKNESGNYGEIDFPGSRKVELLGTLVCDAKGQIFEEAEGQIYFGGNADLLITGGPVSKISKDAVEIVLDGSPKKFRLTPQTETCGLPKANASNVATVVSHSNSDAALSLRQGTMLLLRFDPNSGPRDFDHFGCSD